MNNFGYDKLWGPSQRVVTLFCVVFSENRKNQFMGNPKICKQLKNHRLAHLSSAYLEYWSPASTSLSPPNSRNSLNKADNNEVLPLEAPPGVAIWQLTSKILFSEFWHYLLPVWAVQREGRKICLWSLEGWNIQFLFLILTWYHNVWNLVWCQEKDAFEKRSTGWSPRPTPSSSSSSRRSSLQRTMCCLGSMFSFQPNKQRQIYVE